MGRLVFAVYFRGRILRDCPPSREGPIILIGNHTSILDGILIHGVSRRPLRIFVAAEWVVWRPLRLIFRLMGAIPVDRDRRNPESFDAAVAALERGEAVALFPEGGIRDDGTLGPFRHGVARLALRTGAPVLPCAIIGSFQAQPWPRVVPRPARITIRSGEPLRFPAILERRPRADELTAATEHLHDAVRGLLARGHGTPSRGSHMAEPRTSVARSEASEPAPRR